MTTLNINNKNYQVSTDKAMPLLWVLRDILGLNGTKFGCGSGYCGTCTVIVDGVAVRSCILPVGKLPGKVILTIEGLEISGLHPVQQAWLSESVSQCGYCQSGQIMAAVALLDKFPKPDNEQINQAMSGHLCRCGTYQRIKHAIKKASALLETSQSVKRD